MQDVDLNCQLSFEPNTVLYSKSMFHSGLVIGCDIHSNKRLCRVARHKLAGDRHVSLRAVKTFQVDRGAIND